MPAATEGLPAEALAKAGKVSVVLWANDLKPCISNFYKYISIVYVSIVGVYFSIF